MSKQKSIFSLISVFLIICCFAFAGCKTYHWNLEKTIDEIERIEIIYMNDVYTDDYDFICEIQKSDYSEVIEDIEKLEAHRYFGDLMGTYGKTIRITFINGDFDLISLYAPRHSYSNSEYSEEKSRWGFDIDEFNNLIEKWTEV